MIIHYLIIAFRNLWKYKTQNIISIIGLAVGFVCFACSALWIRYEMSYDSFHPKADRIYRVYIDRFKWSSVGTTTSEIDRYTPYVLSNYLKSNFPEIEDACALMVRTRESYSILYTDDSFCKIFDLKIPEDIFIMGRTDKPVAIANNLVGATESIKELLGFNVQTTFSHWTANSNIHFNVVAPVTVIESILHNMNDWNMILLDTYILMKEGADVQALARKLDKVEIPAGEYSIFSGNPTSIILTPIKQLRYNDPTGNMASNIKFSHIQIFAIAGLLVILCSLFNHLTLNITRVRMRLRELALRKVNGATNRQIATTLYTDFLLVIVLSLAVGSMLLVWLLPTFKEYASIGNSDISIYTELALYAALLIACSIIACGIPVLYFRKQVLNDSIKGYGHPGSGNLFRKSMLLLQLIISLGLIFCSTAFIKQLHFLSHTDLGINRHNVASVSARCCPLTPAYADRLKHVPGVTDVLPITNFGFFKDMTSGSSSTSIEKDGETVYHTVLSITADEHFFDFFGMEIIEGIGFKNKDNKEVINETAKKAMGDAFSLSTVLIGVVRDFYLTPTTKDSPTSIRYPITYRDFDENRFSALAYKYEEDLRKQTEEAITKWYREEFPDQGEFGISFSYMEDIFDDYFKSERALLKLLSIMTLACVLIAIFGVYSLASLTCQQRRKEIAIRKINGAEVLDIMNIFFKEYLILLAIAAIVAFPTGYFIMKRWMEGYVKQTSMDAWLFVLIFLIVFVVIVLSIVSMVWKAANQNPAEVVKSE